MMELNLKKINNINSTDNNIFQFKKNEEFNDFKTFNIFLKNKKIGKFALINFKSYTYFNSFEINKKYRGLGYGKSAFIQILKNLQTKNISTIKLQVEKNNIPALKIYKNSGFKTINTLYTYCMDINYKTKLN